MQRERRIKLIEDIMRQRVHGGCATVVIEESVNRADADDGVHVWNERHENLRRETHDATGSGAGCGGKIDNDAAHAARMLRDFRCECFLRSCLGTKILGVERDHLNGRVAAGSRRVEGAQHSGTLIAGAKEEWEKAVSSGVHEQYT